ncbi:unnamed protein product [Arabis nemorensis]|uniref:Reverse transcriptase zinc-binding domain-containing protein n=1 Tax=Arabis nemorensis TaxID=586526 RepID=A0A565BEW5_9BRAS|nr:unnamed protein product [Arabis nemorensis]
MRPIGSATEEVYDMKVADLLIPSTKEWDVHKIRETLPTFEKEILCIKLSLTDVADKHIWIPQASGDYTTRTGYHITYSENPRQIATANANREFNWKSEIWEGQLSEKLKLFLWKVMQKALTV